MHICVISINQFNFNTEYKCMLQMLSTNIHPSRAYNLIIVSKVHDMHIAAKNPLPE